MCLSWVSLKLAVIQTSSSGTTVSSCCPGLNIQPDDHSLVHFAGDRRNDFRVLEVQLSLLEQRALLLHVGDGSAHTSLG